MISNVEKYIEDIKRLIQNGEQLLIILEGDNENLIQFREKYEIWYSEAYYLIKSLLPDRLKDFELYYENKKGDSLRKALTYTPPISEGILLAEFDYKPAKQIDFARSLFVNQLAIVKSVQRRFESSLFDIRQLVQADLFDSQLDAARELNQKGFTRGAGAIAGVVLEGHLLQVCDNHKISVRKKNPGINDLAQLLKNSDVVDTSEWRKIQHLADLRNLCDHKKKDEPNKEKIDELIEGTSKIIKTLF